MAVQFFAPKTLGSVTLGAGALTGGGAIYWYQMPRTGKELLIKEGFLFLNSEYDYKGMFNDQKTNTDGQSETSLSDANENNVNSKAKPYCEQKLDTALPSSSDADYSKTKQKLISFCTTDGIKTVKARLIQSKKTGWLGDQDEEKWKTVFAVYRYEPRFINGLKEDDKTGNAGLKQSSNVSEYTKLKKACEKLLKRDYKETPEDHIKYGSGWCVDPGYTTIRDKIQKTDPSGSEKEQSDTDGGTLVKTGKLTEQVTKWANTAKSQGDTEELSEDSLKELCNKKHVEAKLSVDDSYRDKYIVIKSVCKKTTK